LACLAFFIANCAARVKIAVYFWMNDSVWSRPQ
jgi:hypothetical protein